MNIDDKMNNINERLTTRDTIELMYEHSVSTSKMETSVTRGKQARGDVRSMRRSPHVLRKEEEEEEN